MKTVLITGIHGFVGSNIVEALKDDYGIYGIDIKFPEKEGVVKTFSWEDLEEDRIPDVDAIIHLAGLAHDIKNSSDDELYFKVNTGLTKKAFDYFEARPNIRKFILFSSVKAAADKVEGEILTEDIVPSPVGPYGESKIKAEEYLLDKLKASPENFEDKEVVIMRPCMIHGPGNRGNLNLLYSVIRHGVPWPLGAFENKRSFTSIDNLTFIIGALLEKPVESGIYNMADDEPMSTNQLVETICCAMGKNAHIWRVNRSLINGIARLGDSMHLPLNTFRLGKLTENYVVSNRKIKDALGIGQMPVDPRDGIIRTINSFQNQEV